MKVYKFYAKGCGPCMVLENNLQKSGIKYIGVNVANHEEYASPDDDYSLIEYYNIKSIPTLLIVDDEGKEVERRRGIVTVDQLKELKDMYKL